MTQQLELTDLRREWIDEACERFPTLQLPENWSAEDLHNLLPAPIHCNWWGVLTAKLKCARLIDCVGYQTSTRPERNGGVVRVWTKI
jgi:hypothetical protein